MKTEFLARSPLLALPLFALVLFIIVFTAVLVKTLRKKAPAYDPLANLPLDDGELATDAERNDPRNAEKGAPR